jgi:hypothetical protein
VDLFAIIFMVANSAALLALPRRWAPLPLLIGACYMTLGQGVHIGPFSFTVLRLLVPAGVLRILIKSERLAGGITGLDWVILAWGAAALLTSLLHEDRVGTLINRLGEVYNAFGIYFLLRVFCRSLSDVVGLCCATAILLVPVALAMVFEKITARDLFAFLGGVPFVPAIREGKIRAQGPFAHAILAGTVGAVCLPLMIGIWKTHRRLAITGILACLGMVGASTSSGPLLTVYAVILGFWMWRFRDRMRQVRWLIVFGYIALDLVMKAPAYYLLARLDLTGGSTGWHRARLIESAFEHFSEWWFAGTDYTRHWMPTGVIWSPNHTDITNHYLAMGVHGGLGLMILFIASLVKGYSYVGQSVVYARRLNRHSNSQFMMWSLGVALFAHTVTSFSISYFDQSFLFIYLTLAAIGSARSALSAACVRQRAILAQRRKERLPTRPFAGGLAEVPSTPG